MPDAAHILRQRGEDLGARMHHTFVDLFALGYRGVIVIGTDLPTLPPAHLEMAVELLSVPDPPRVVLGPVDDGGYCVMGLTRPASGLFEGIAWSTPQVFAQTIAAADRIGLEVVRLPPWYDIDTPEDLTRLAADLQGLPAQVAPFTREWLRENGVWNKVRRH